MEYVCSFCSEKGQKKEVNEDALLLFQARDPVGARITFAVVCDGVGGMKKGERTSAAVVLIFAQWFEERMPFLCEQEDWERALLQEWQTIVYQLHGALQEQARYDGIRSGTTLEALLLYRGKYCICHVGDCRVYLLRKHLRLLTHDHTFVQREIDAGRMTPEQAQKDNRKSLLLQCIGAGSEVRPDLACGTAEDGDLFLVCCDGLRRRISEKEMEKQLSRAKSRGSEKYLDAALDTLTALCRKRGEKDDISAVAALQSKPPQAVWPLQFWKKPQQSPQTGAFEITRKEICIHTAELPQCGNSNKTETDGTAEKPLSTKNRRN